ncbi:outer membrane protein assembly factor BamB family protein [Parvularcula lutaonensis]|uniref:PQQ-binding-like beta-propeller repeat protein n=1 Tax=Parvularcula lutaonensis TaxID=491923 RepID=A0ABV7M9J4_9PROT|nr:PQQ-binding-like beta-propeller repeat protein [Parvularcula lutaonensis]GGY44658.1 pyrrolo-quinoline quinone [Parvularcula lutaonensis]
MIARTLKLAGLAGLALLAVSCSSNGGSAEDREFADAVAVLAPEEVIEPDPELAGQGIVVPPPLANETWPQVAGAPDHTLIHVAAPAELVRAWRARVISPKAKKAPITSTPVVGTELLYNIDAVANVMAVDRDTGKKVWETTLTPDVRDRAARRLNIFARVKPADLGFGGGAALAEDRLFVTSGFGFIAALDARSGELLWQVETGSPMRNPPTVAGGLVIAVSISNEVFALDQATGEERWGYESFEESARFLAAAAPAVDGRSVVVPFSSGEVTSLDLINGRVNWQQTISRTSKLNALSVLGDIAASPIIDRGAVFSVSQSGQMAGIDLRTGAVAWERPVGGYHTPWLAGETIYIVSNAGQFVAVNRIDGRIRFVVDLPAFKNERRKKKRISWAGPVLGGGRLWLAGSNGELIGLSPQNGEIEARYRLKDGANLPPVIAGGTIYVITEKGFVEAFGEAAQ